MSFQVLTVAVVVALSFGYAAWTLMPQALRAPFARLLLGLPIPGFMRQRLLDSANARACGACSGCDKAPVSTANGLIQKLGVQAQPLVFHPRRAK
jgi:hypothetical protein